PPSTPFPYTTLFRSIIAGGEQPFSEVPWFWTDQYETNLQMAGAPDTWDRIVFRGEPTDPGFTVFQLDGAGKVVAAVTVNNARDIDRKSTRLNSSHDQ